MNFKAIITLNRLAIVSKQERRQMQASKQAGEGIVRYARVYPYAVYALSCQFL